MPIVAGKRAVRSVGRMNKGKPSGQSPLSKKVFSKRR